MSPEPVEGRHQAISTDFRSDLVVRLTASNDDRMAWVYILRCADDSFYVGSTRNLDDRLHQHAVGRVDSYTRTRRPLELAWALECEHIGEAFALEHKLKGWRRAKKIALIEGRLADLPALSRTRAASEGSPS